MKHTKIANDVYQSRHSTKNPVLPHDPRNPGSTFLQQEIDSNRRAERLLIPKALIALMIVAILIAIREVFFV
jgi:hypothetical protein